MNWTVPGDIDPGNDYRIVISGEGSMQLTDASNSDFEVMDNRGVSVNPIEPDIGGFNIYPNPVNGILNIEYTVEDSESLTIKLYNLAGIELETILDKSNTPGMHRLTHYMDNYPAGTYVIQLQYNTHTQSRIFNHLKD